MLNDLFINTTAYYTVTLVLYIVAVIFFVLLISSKARSTVQAIFLRSIRAITQKTFYPALISNIQKFFKVPLYKVLSITFRFISNISVNFKKAEEFFTGKMFPIVIEPVNILSLLIRKAYTDTKTIVISVMAGLIVAFYFILTIF